MAALGLRVCIVLSLTVWVLGGRTHQPQLHRGSRPPSPAAVANAYNPAAGGQCDAVLLSSLSTFVTSGAGYAEAAPFTQPGAARALNSSAADGAHKFEPTPPHKPLWPSWSQRDVWLFALSAITLFIAGGHMQGCSSQQQGAPLPPMPPAGVHACIPVSP